jgi:hypothetical protein
MIQDPNLTQQLQEEGVEILKSIREGSPEAFQTILSEVSRYNLFIGGVQAFFGLVSVTCLLVLARWALNKRDWKLNYVDGSDTHKLVITIVLVIFFSILGPVGLVHGIDNMSVGISPLGWLVTNMVN